MNNRPTRASRESEEAPYRSIFDAATDGIILADSETGIVVEANPAACAMHGYSREAFIGLHAAAFIHPDSQHVFGNYMRTVRSGAAADTQVLHVRRNGSTFHAKWRGTAFTYRGRPCLLGVVRDVSRRIQAEQRLRKRVEARTREQSALLEISHALASTPELQPHLVLEQLRAIIEYTHAALFGLTDSTLTALAVCGPPQLERAAPFQIRLEGPMTLAALFNGHRPIRVADVSSAEPAAEFLRSLLTGDAAVLLQGVCAWMWVPLAVKGRILGGVGVAHARRNHFTAHHAALALSTADQVAITMVNAELHENDRALAALEERQRLAQDLHDAVNQSLFTAGLIAEVLPRLWELDPVEARQSLEDLRRLTRGALAEMRGLLAELRPSVLTDSSLGDLLRQLANAFTGRTNVPATVTIAAEQVLSARLQVAVYRICQEALSNIAKHAEASRVEIDLRYGTAAAPASSSHPHAATPQEVVVRSVEMRIRDDGRGFDRAQPAASGHYGLGIMHERAEAVGARLTVTTQPGHGTEIAMCWQGSPEQEAR
jgi:PAS domain S-box-containing protein